MKFSKIVESVPKNDAQNTCFDFEASILVPLPEGCALWFSDSSRNCWSHSIDREDLQNRRISVTFRDLSAQFSPPHSLLLKQDGITSQQEDGILIKKLAQTYLPLDGIKKHQF
eukprot:Sdes_comp20258_c0_seq6m13731